MAAPEGAGSGLDLGGLLERVVIGGWPELLSASARDATLWLRDYLHNVAEVDIPGLGPRRHPTTIARLFAALGRAAATPINHSQRLSATLSSWHDSQTGLEADAILALPDGTWAAIEVKLGESAADSAAESLLRVAGKIDNSRHGPPRALIVVTAGRLSYRRPDGVIVVPITALGP